jgi:hypothetical protein
MSEYFNTTTLIILNSNQDLDSVLSKKSILSKTVIVFLTIIGFAGNAIGCYILSKLKKETIFHYFYINNIIGFVGIFLIWLHFIPIYFNMNITDMYCKIYLYFGFSGYYVYPWINVLNSIDRLFSLKYPQKFKFRKQFKYHRIAIAVIIFIILGINVPYIIYEGRNENGVDFMCYIENDLIALYLTANGFFWSIFLPSCLMLASTLIITQFLITQKRNMRQNTVNYKREKEFVKSTLTMDLWFILCYSSLAITDLLQYTLNEQELNSEAYKNIRNLSAVLGMMEFTCNTYVLMLCNKVFRNHVKCKVCCCFFRNHVQPFEAPAS